MIKKRAFTLTLEEFGRAIGLSALDREMVRQKNRVIDYLKAVRLKKHLSQGELARRLGTKQPAIARMEAGYVGEVSFDFLMRVALALGITIDVRRLKTAA